MSSSRRLILTYHSISSGLGPTCISPDIFRDQTSALADAGFVVYPLTRFVELWKAGALSGVNAAAITFDDAFADFHAAALPVLARHRWQATVFAPAAKIGACDDWETPPAGQAPRPLMSWADLRGALQAGHEVGSHSMTHADLTTVDDSLREWEACESQQKLRDELGAPVTAFAAPYGKSNAALDKLVRRCYSTSVGTSLNCVPSAGSPYNLPRIEMWYFRDPVRWRSFLSGRQTYFQWRRTLRTVREKVSRTLFGRSAVRSGFNPLNRRLSSVDAHR